MKRGLPVLTARTLFFTALAVFVIWVLLLLAMAVTSARKPQETASAVHVSAQM